MNFRGILPTTIFLLASLIFSLTLFSPRQIHSIAGHLVISEIQVGGAVTGSSENDFVELYNPTEQPISLSGLHLSRKTKSSTLATPLVATLSGTIASHAYYLIANPNYTTIPVTPDITYDADVDPISANNTIILYAADNTTIIDKVGYGTANDSESADAIAPANGKSIERKALSTSTSPTMKLAGVDEFAGNGEDTNNNSADFVLRDLPQPQNSSSTTEPLATTPTPIITITPSITVSPSPTPIATPTLTLTPIPTATPSPTVTPIPSPTPTANPTPTITMTPIPTITVTPTVSPTPIATPSPTVVPTVTPTPLPNPTTNIFAYFNVVIKQMQNQFKFFFPFLQF